MAESMGLDNAHAADRLLSTIAEDALDLASARGVNDPALRGKALSAIAFARNDYSLVMGTDGESSYWWRVAERDGSAEAALRVRGAQSRASLLSSMAQRAGVNNEPEKADALYELAWRAALQVEAERVAQAAEAEALAAEAQEQDAPPQGPDSFGSTLALYAHTEEHAEQIADLSVRAEAYCQMANRSRATEPERARQLYLLAANTAGRALRGGADEARPLSVLRRVAIATGETRIAEVMPPGRDRDIAMSEVIAQWAIDNMDVAFAITIPNPEARGRAICEIIAKTETIDIEQAKAQVLEIPERSMWRARAMAYVALYAGRARDALGDSRDASVDEEVRKLQEYAISLTYQIHSSDEENSNAVFVEEQMIENFVIMDDPYWFRRLPFFAEWQGPVSAEVAVKTENPILLEQAQRLDSSYVGYYDFAWKRLATSLNRPELILKITDPAMRTEAYLDYYNKLAAAGTTQNPQ
jgi:hypothetical protein